MMTINREDEWKIEGLEVTAPLDTERYLELEPLVNEIASSEWKGSTAFSIDDVAQAIWLHMMEKWSEYEKADEHLVRYMARRAARVYCEKQRIDYMYATGSFLYTPGIVRRSMEFAWSDLKDCPDIDIRMDISEAYEHLSRPQKAAIYKKYALKEPLVTSAEKAAEYRGINAITHRLNTGLRLTPEGY